MRKEKMNFKPMLAPNDQPDLNKIKYPMLVSPKLDGIRCIFINGEMLSRSLKPIRNTKLQEKFKFLKELSKKHGIFDGELYSSDLTFQEITHYVMTEETSDLPEHIKFYCFDALNNSQTPFKERVTFYTTILQNHEECVCVPQLTVNSADEIKNLFNKAINEGFEGLILKNPESLYKYGRATMKENLMYKIKPYQTYDLPVLDVYERMENLSESKINELGYKQKERHINNLKPTGIAAGFITKYKNKEMKVTITGDEGFRKHVWDNKEKYIGKIMEVKAMDIGSKEVLRHPVFVRFREDKQLPY